MLAKLHVSPPTESRPSFTEPNLFPQLTISPASSCLPDLKRWELEALEGSQHLQNPSHFPKVSNVHVASHQAASLMLIFLLPLYFMLTTEHPQLLMQMSTAVVLFLLVMMLPFFAKAKGFVQICLLPDLFLICFAFYSFFFLFFSHTIFCFYVLLSFHFLLQVAGTVDIHLHLIFLGLSLTHKYLLSLLALSAV